MRPANSLPCAFLPSYADAPTQYSQQRARTHARSLVACGGPEHRRIQPGKRHMTASRRSCDPACERCAPSSARARPLSGKHLLGARPPCALCTTEVQACTRPSAAAPAAVPVSRPHSILFASSASVAVGPPMPTATRTTWTLSSRWAAQTPPPPPPPPRPPRCGAGRSATRCLGARGRPFGVLLTSRLLTIVGHEAHENSTCLQARSICRDAHFTVV